jgi:hypothetical protein
MLAHGADSQGRESQTGNEYIGRQQRDVETVAGMRSDRAQQQRYQAHEKDEHEIAPQQSLSQLTIERE